MIGSTGLTKRRSEIRQLISNPHEDILADMYSVKQLNGTESDHPISLNRWSRISIA